MQNALYTANPLQAQPYGVPQALGGISPMLGGGQVFPPPISQVGQLGYLPGQLGALGQQPISIAEILPILAKTLPVVLSTLSAQQVPLSQLGQLVSQQFPLGQLGQQVPGVQAAFTPQISIAEVLPLLARTLPLVLSTLGVPGMQQQIPGHVPVSITEIAPLLARVLPVLLPVLGPQAMQLSYLAQPGIQPQQVHPAHLIQLAQALQQAYHPAQLSQLGPAAFVPQIAVAEILPILGKVLPLALSTLGISGMQQPLLGQQFPMGQLGQLGQLGLGAQAGYMPQITLQELLPILARTLPQVLSTLGMQQPWQMTQQPFGQQPWQMAQQPFGQQPWQMAQQPFLGPRI